MCKRALLAVTFFAVVASLAGTSTARAQITLGELPPGAAEQCSSEFGGNVVDFAVGPSPDRIPAAGVITSWSTRVGSAVGQEMYFQVLRPVPPLTNPEYFAFTVVGHDGSRDLAPGTVNTFPADIAVAPGDTLGLFLPANGVSTDCFFRTEEAEEGFLEFFGGTTDGETLEGYGDGENKVRLNLSATLLVAPTITSVSPASGPAAGGTLVQISGSEFARVQSVEIGSTEVPFEVVSETAITTTAPTGDAGQIAPVTVTTEAGSAAGTFDYDAAATAPTVSTSSSPGAGPQVRFAIGKPSIRKANGTAVLPVTVPGPGVLTVGPTGTRTPPHLRKVTMAVAGPGTVSVPLTVTGAGHRPLRRKSRIKVVPLVTFTPSGGVPSALYRPVELRLTR